VECVDQAGGHSLLVTKNEVEFLHDAEGELYSTLRVAKSKRPGSCKALQVNGVCAHGLKSLSRPSRLAWRQAIKAPEGR
jgi:hypothetical protein